jgi:hypothetical protein
MPTILKNILSFTGLSVGVPVALPHGLNVNGTPVKPAIGGLDAGGFTVTADTVNVTVTRQASGPAAVQVYVEHWHTIEAVTPAGSNTLDAFTPFFFSNSGGGGGGSGPGPTSTQIVYVNKGGNDGTGDGSFSQPFLTIQAAMTAITDATLTKRYVLDLGPGTYSDPFALKPWFAIVGHSNLPTRISGVITFSADWTPAGDHRSSFQNITFPTVAQVFDFNTVASNEGKLLFQNCVFNLAPTFSAFSAINQVSHNGCMFFAGFTQIGINHTLSNCFMQNGGLMSLTSVNDGRNLPTILTGFGGGSDGGLTAVWTLSGGANQIQISLRAFAIQGHVTLDGASIAYLTGSEGFPKPANLTQLNAAPAPIQVTG